MKQKLVSLTLALTLALGLLTGCGDRSTSSEVDPKKAYQKHDPSDVVMTVNQSDVTWSEFFNSLYGIVYQIKYYSEDGLVDWEAACATDNTMTNGEYSWDYAVNTCLQYHVVETKAREMGITLTEEDRQSLDQQLQSDMQDLCGEGATEEAFNEALNDVYLSREAYDYINEVYCLYDKLYSTVCGTGGEYLTQEDIDACIQDNQYATVKHILISTLDPEGNPMEGQDLAEKTALATLLLTQLQAVQDDPAALESKFDELMNQYSDDTGLPYYPDGYTFRPGEMVQEFEDAASALEAYQLYPELVASDYGYHIILRLPTTRDSVVTYVNASTSYTIGDYAAADAFHRLLNSWIDEADVEWKAPYEKLTAEKVFQ